MRSEIEYTSNQRASAGNCRNKEIRLFQESVYTLLRDFFWVIPRRLNFICRRFGTLFHLHRQVGMKYLPAYEDGTKQSVPKRRHIKFRLRGITQKKAYNIQNMAKV